MNVIDFFIKDSRAICLTKENSRLAVLFRLRNKYVTCDKRKLRVNQQDESKSLPYQLVQVFVIDMSVHVSKITAHCHDDIVRSIEFSLCLNITYELGDLNKNG